MSAHALGRILAVALFGAGAVLAWYTFRTWQAEGWSPLARQLVFSTLAAVTSAIAGLYFL
jgi:hypothetical protein